MKQLTANVYTNTKEIRGCHSSFVVTKDGAAVIDTPVVPAEARQWRETISSFAPIRYVFNNEAHPDHYGGNCYMGGTVVGTEETFEIISSDTREHVEEILDWLAPDALPLDETFSFRTPDIALKGEATFYLGDHTFHILWVPGHTPSQLAVHVPEERIVFTSDNVNLGMPIFLDAVPYEWLESLDRLAELDVDIVVPGHGAITDKTAFPRMKADIEVWLDVVGRTVAEGLGLEDAIRKASEAKELANIPKDGRDAEFFPIFVERVYRAILSR